MSTKIESLNLNNLHNEEHVHFGKDFSGLVVVQTPETLNIVEEFGVYTPLYLTEVNSLDVVQKSAVTQELIQANATRNFTFRGMSDLVKSSGNHFSMVMQQAATRVQVVFDSYGNLTSKTNNEESSAIDNLITDLNTNHAADVQTLGLSEWLTTLQANNDAYIELENTRYTEDAGKPDTNMKDARVQVDAAYHIIINRINALILINGDAVYATFVGELNLRIDHYNTLIAQRKGHSAKPTVPPEGK